MRMGSGWRIQGHCEVYPDCRDVQRTWSKDRVFRRPYSVAEVSEMRIWRDTSIQRLCPGENRGRGTAAAMGEMQMETIDVQAEVISVSGGLTHGIRCYVTSKAIRKRLRPIQKQCPHWDRFPAVIVASNGSEHMVQRCSVCHHNVFVSWDVAIMGRAPMRIDPISGELKPTKHQLLIQKQTPATIKTLKKSHPFYDSPEWRCLRYKALKMHGPICQLCGSRRGPIHVDHIKPRSKYPELELCLDNLQVLCRDCNLGKSNKYEDDWRPMEKRIDGYEYARCDDTKKKKGLDLPPF